MHKRKIIRLPGHSNFVEDCSYSRDSSKIVSCSGDGKLILWQTETGTLQPIGRHNGEVWSCDYSPCDRYICSASSDKTVRIWDPRLQGHIVKFTGHTDTVWSCAFDPCLTSCHIASASSDKSVKIWNWRTLSVERNLKNHKNNTEHVAFSKNGEGLVTCSRDKTVQILEDHRQDSTGEAKVLSKHKKRVNYCAFFGSQDEFVLSCSDDKTIRVWDRYSLQNTKTIYGHQNIVWCCDVIEFHDNTLIASVSSDKSLRFWDMATGRELKRIKQFDEYTDSRAQLLSCHVSPNQSQLAVTSNNANLYLVDLRDILDEIKQLDELSEEEPDNYEVEDTQQNERVL